MIVFIPCIEVHSVCHQLSTDKYHRLQPDCLLITAKSKCISKIRTAYILGTNKHKPHGCWMVRDLYPQVVLVIFSSAWTFQAWWVIWPWFMGIISIYRKAMALASLVMTSVYCHSNNWVLISWKIMNTGEHDRTVLPWCGCITYWRF